MPQLNSKMEIDIKDPESFRDTIGTIGDDGKRVWVNPKKPKGKYTNWRTNVNYILLALLFTGPWIKIDGKPFLLFNILERKFIIFGQVFWPQDFHLAVLAMITGIVFVALFTIVYGRIFCGWACPQTIFMEGVFRKIEYWIDGDYKQQKQLAKQEWNAEKIRKRVLKHTIFIIISFLITHTFLAYIIGADALLEIQTGNPVEHIAGLISITLFTGVFYFVFSWFREQVCIIACPYGRLQGVLLDRNSIVVAYDFVRGENRAKFKKNEDRKAAQKGDCIDCHQCVDVCPTGIDIRNGTQLECVNCTACIDVCNTMMKGVGLPENLIRYDSADGIAKGKKFEWTARIKGYSFVLLILLLVIMGLLLSRNEVETTLLRTPGVMYQEQPDGRISNLYNIKIINKTYKDLPIELKLLSPANGEIQVIGKKNLEVLPESVNEGSLFILINKKDLPKMKNKIEVGVYSNGELIEEVSTNFLAPTN